MAKDVGEVNRVFFDELASVYDTKPIFKKITARLTLFVQENLSVIYPSWSTTTSDNNDHPTVHLLDYACGTGSITAALSPCIGRATGIDVSSNMVSAYNKRFAEGSAMQKAMQHPVQAHAVVGNLFSANGGGDALKGDEFYGFDVAGVGVALHHFEEPALAIRKLVERLRPGGVLFIVDMLVEDGQEFDGDWRPRTDAAATITQPGFKEQQMRDMLQAEGIVDVEFRVMDGWLEFKEDEMKKAVPHGHGHDHGHSHSHGSEHEHGHKHAWGERRKAFLVRGTRSQS